MDSNKAARIDFVLSMIFLVLVGLTFLTYFIYRDEHPFIFMYIGISAILLRVVTYFLRWKFRR